MSAIARYRHLDSERLARPVSRPQLNRSFISTACVLLALSLSLSCQSKLDSAGAKIPSSRESTDTETVDLIARVKDASVSGLEKGLPTVRFEDWVRENTGPDWTITWRFVQAYKVHSSGFDFPGSVDVRGDTKDGQYFRLSIGTATNANQVLLFWHSGAANVQHRWVALQHLSQLPRLLHHASQSSHTSVGQK
jgi:hypothetical protein